jgi:DNA ligase (NAD+)
MEQYQNFILTGEKNQVDTWLGQVDKAYESGTSGMSDATYDYLIMLYEGRFGPRGVVGAPATGDEVPLPIAMMSLDKIMKHEPQKLKNWVSKNPGPYVTMDKIDGNPGLYVISVTPEGPKARLFKRGDGTKGPEITQILPYLKLPLLPFDIQIKGELVIDKKDYEPHRGDGPDQYKTNLSMVAGLTNWRNSDPNPEHLKLIKFIAFDMSFPKQQNLEFNMSQTLDQLDKYGFRTPFRMKTPGLSIDWLSSLYQRQRDHQTYNVDGIVIVDDKNIKYTERLIRENPKYAVAYKEYGDIYETTVTEVVWEASKHGVLTPVVHVEDTPVGDGKTIRHPTGHNAKFLVDHGIGVGARVQVIMNTIPKIIGTVEGYRVTPAVPNPDKYPPGSWEWNESGVEIVLKNKDTDEIKIAKLYEFFKKDKINAKGWGEKKVEALYYAGFNTLKKLLETTKEGFMKAKIEGVGEKGIENLIQSRDYALSHASVAAIMAGSTTFDHGIGKRMIEKVLEVYPDILTMEEPTAEDIMGIEGFADKKAYKFIEGLPKFKKFLADIPVLQKAVKGELKVQVNEEVKPVKVAKTAGIQAVGKPTGETLQGKAVVFTGFRDAALEASIVGQGGVMKTGVSKNIHYVITNGPKGEDSAKANKARDYGIPVLSIAEFKGRFGL